VPEAALLIEVPEAEPLVGGWRLAHDPVAARGVPAHITILFPFAGTPDAVAALAARHEPFDYALTRLDEFPGVLWLAPEPSSAFVDLTREAMAEFPGTKPYNGAHSEIVPHVTVAMSATPELRDEVAEQLAPHLPLSARATHLAVYESDEDGEWRRVARCPFADGAA